MVWTEGRQLAAVTYTENTQTVTLLSYTYDENGIRTSKTYEGITTYYTTEDGRITSQYQLDGNGNKTEEIIFIYNKSGELIAAEYSGKTYYYAKNVMGDVCAIVDDTGTQIVSYNYYAFGTAVSNVNTSATSSDQHFAAINPMQYRSYYWDDDLGAYYLQSRYYAPDWCRFVNADIPEIANMTKEHIAGINLFAYCNNDPVNNSDPNGNVSWKDLLNIIKKIISKIGVICKRYKKSIKYKDPKKIYKYVNENKSKIKSFKNNISSIATFLGILMAVVNVGSILARNKYFSLAVAEILFYGLVRLVSYGLEKLVEFIVKYVLQGRIVLKYIVRAVLNKVIDFALSRKWVERLKNNYLSYVNVKRISFTNYLYALFYGARDLIRG